MLGIPYVICRRADDHTSILALNHIAHGARIDESITRDLISSLWRPMREAGVGSMIGQRLGAYQLEAELGRGSMGIVYRARHTEQNKVYAIKVLLDALVTDTSFITRFTREAHIVATLNHPNLVRVYEAGREGEYIYFVMEYFPGSTAGQLLKERKRLPYGEVVEIAAQAADALAYAHATGRLVHRDIKPENILVDRWRRVKVLDFGLARIEGLDTITRQGTVVGSLYYVSPEQLLGRKLDGRTDVYALGVSMYEMLTGQRPYRGQTLPEMSDAILYGAATPPSKLEPTIPRSLEAIIARAMARDLAQRYPNADELYAALRALQSTLANAGDGTAAPTPPSAGASSADGRDRRDGRDLTGQNGHASHTPAAPDAKRSLLAPSPPAQPAPTSQPQRPAAVATSATSGSPFQLDQFDQFDPQPPTPQPAAPPMQPAFQRSLRTSLRPTTLEPASDALRPKYPPRPTTDAQD